MTTWFPSRLLRNGRVAMQVWWSFLIVHYQLRRFPLPKAVAHLRGRMTGYSFQPQGTRLGRIVDRLLRLGRFEARCLIKSLVLFRLLRKSGSSVDLVIGIPEATEAHDAHAWVELDGKDLGPPPGRGAHQELVRYS
jgi:hypothetical protein